MGQEEREKNERMVEISVEMDKDEPRRKRKK
jgi:hypothetical protein